MTCEEGHKHHTEENITFDYTKIGDFINKIQTTNWEKIVAIFKDGKMLISITLKNSFKLNKERTGNAKKK